MKKFLALLLLLSQFAFAASNGLLLPNAKLNTELTYVSPITHAALGYDHNERLFCATGMTTDIKDSDDNFYIPVFCVDYKKVHVYVGQPDTNAMGTWVIVKWHLAYPENSHGYVIDDYTDFITVFVGTEAERKQWQDALDYVEHNVYHPRAVHLDTPSDWNQK